MVDHELAMLNLSKSNYWKTWVGEPKWK